MYVGSSKLLRSIHKFTMDNVLVPQSILDELFDRRVCQMLLRRHLDFGLLGHPCYILQIAFVHHSADFSMSGCGRRLVGRNWVFVVGGLEGALRVNVI